MFRTALRVLSVFIFVAGLVLVIRIPSDSAHVRAASDNFLGQREEMLQKYKDRTGKDAKENLAWIPQPIGRTPGLVPAYNGFFAFICFLGTILCLTISLIPLPKKFLSKAVP